MAIPAFTFHVEGNLDVTILEYGATFPGPRRNVLNALATTADVIARNGQPGSIIRTQRLSYSPVTIAFARITGQEGGVPLLRAQATMVLHAIEMFMQDHRPRELTRTEIFVGGEKATGLSLVLYFATVDTGNTTMEIWNANLEIGNTTIEIGNTTLEIGNTIIELGSANADTGTS